MNLFSDANLEQETATLSTRIEVKKTGIEPKPAYGRGTTLILICAPTSLTRKTKCRNYDFRTR